MLLTVGNFFSLSSNCRISKNGEKRNKKPTTTFPSFTFFLYASWWCFNVASIGHKIRFLFDKKRGGGALKVFYANKRRRWTPNGKWCVPANALNSFVPGHWGCFEGFLEAELEKWIAKLLNFKYWACRIVTMHDKDKDFKKTKSLSMTACARQAVHINHKLRFTDAIRKRRRTKRSSLFDRLFLLLTTKDIKWISHLFS